MREYNWLVWLRLSAWTPVFGGPKVVCRTHPFIFSPLPPISPILGEWKGLSASLFAFKSQTPLQGSITSDAQHFKFSVFGHEKVGLSAWIYSKRNWWKLRRFIKLITNIHQQRMFLSTNKVRLLTWYFSIIACWNSLLTINYKFLKPRFSRRFTGHCSRTASIRTIEQWGRFRCKPIVNKQFHVMAFRLPY